MPKSVTTNGRRCIHICSSNPGHTLAKRRNADFLLRQSTGYCVAEHNGGYLLRNMATGIASTNDLPAGAIIVFWRICINILLATRIWRISCWTARLCEHIPVRPEPEKKWGSRSPGAWTQPRWIQHQDPRHSVDALGNPLRFRLTGGQRHDITQADDLIANFDFERVIADRSYDSDEFLQKIAEKEAEAVIPPRKNRKDQREYDRHLYKERHLIECLFNKIKHYRRIFSRFEKLDKRLLGFLSFAGVLLWLR